MGIHKRIHLDKKNILTMTMMLMVISMILLLNQGLLDQREMSVSHGGMLNIGYNFSDVLKLKYTKFYTKDSSNVTRVTDGILGSNDEHLTIYNLDWEERELNSRSN